MEHYLTSGGQLLLVQPIAASLIAASELINTSVIVPGTNLYSSVGQDSFPEESAIRIAIGNFEINRTSVR